MNDPKYLAGSVDRYVRDDMSEQEEADFEVALLESSDLQDDLADVLYIREALAEGFSEPQGPAGNFTPARSGFTDWRPVALAASLVAALVSTVLYVQSRTEAGRLQEQLAALQAPSAQVLEVSVDLMRSTGNQTPDVIVQKPAGASVILLDIELSPRFREQDVIRFQLRHGETAPLLTWIGSPNPNGRSRVILRSDTLPDGLVRLELQGTAGGPVEHRLLEFRAPR